MAVKHFDAKGGIVTHYLRTEPCKPLDREGANTCFNRFDTTLGGMRVESNRARAVMRLSRRLNSDLSNCTTVETVERRLHIRHLDRGRSHEDHEDSREDE